MNVPQACCQPQSLAFAENAGAAVQLWLGLGLGVTLWLTAWRQPETHVQTVHLSLQQLAIVLLSSVELACEERVRKTHVEAQHPPACVFQVVRHAAACLVQLRVVPEQLVFHPTRVAAVLVGHSLG